MRSKVRSLDFDLGGWGVSKGVLAVGHEQGQDAAALLVEVVGWDSSKVG